MTNRIHIAYHWHGDTATWKKRLAVIKAGDIVVFNPSNGPIPDDPAELANCRQLISQVRDRAAAVLGYIHLAYGDRSWADVFSDLKVWQEYGVYRHFFDEAPSEMNKFWERRLVGAINPSPYNGVKGVFNLGTAPLNGWAPDIGNLAVTWEGRSVDFPTRNWKSWEVAIAYGVPEPLGRRSDGPLWQAWTSDDLPNPYDSV